ncbi:acyl--CoA ligase [Colwellia echini]|uniref:Acyl--CoA ligase n=2 Tax=Colwellia echini TaxID=1982103 RepID=A0ABY3MWT6_9GAMM|nr:acyl--CoA ligase [Colwellia echini]
MNIYQRINEHNNHSPNKVACIYNEQQVTYHELLSQVDRFAQGLVNIGVTPNTRIALLCPNNMQFVVVLLAVAKIGASVAPLPLTLKGKALTLAITGAECDFAIAWPTAASLLVSNNILSFHKVITLDTADFKTALDPKKTRQEWLYSELLNTPLSLWDSVANIDSDFILTMTSGSTGSPKPIIFTQQTKIERAFKATINYYQLIESDTVLVATPLYHSLAQRSLLMPLMLGATVVILPKFSLPAWLNAISTHKVSFLFTVASQLVALLTQSKQNSTRENKLNFSSLRCIVSSSATLKEEDKKRLLSVVNCHFHECYGASEVGVVTDFDITEQGVPLGSVGRALPGITVKICDDKRETLPCGKIGEIACLTPTRFKGYFNLPEQTRASFDDEGYFYTGDLGYLDEQGYLYFVGRTKEVIKTGGINVYPQDIESVLIELPEIKECAAIGITDDKFGEVIWVAYVLADDHPFDEKKLKLQAMQQLTDYQQPRFYQCFDAFPKSALGKVLKQEIKAKLIADRNTFIHSSVG